MRFLFSPNKWGAGKAIPCKIDFPTINLPSLENFFSFHKILLMSTYYCKLRKPESHFDKILSKNCGKQDSKLNFYKIKRPSKDKHFVPFCWGSFLF